MGKKRWIAIFIVMCVLQIGTIALIISINEGIIRGGKEVKFLVEPIDPYDAFRGKYVAINMNTSIPKGDKVKYEKNMSAYVTVRVDNNDFGVFEKVVFEKPKNGIFLKIKVEYENTSDGKVKIKNPFARYYIEEKYSQRAESAYSSEVLNKRVYIKTRIKDGRGVIEELYYDDKPVKQYLKEKEGKKI